MIDPVDDTKEWRMVDASYAELDLGVDSLSAVPGDVAYYSVELRPATKDGAQACCGHDHLVLRGRRARRAYGAVYRGTERTVRMEVSLGALIAHVRACGHEVEVASHLEEEARACLAVHEVELECMGHHVRFICRVQEESYLPRQESFHVPYRVLTALLRRRGHVARLAQGAGVEGSAAGAIEDPWVPAPRRPAGGCPECGVAPTIGFPSFDHAVNCSRRR